MLSRSNSFASLSFLVFSTLAMAAPTTGPSTQPTLAGPAKVGDRAPDFSLEALDDSKVSLHDALKDGPVVLVVLRGWPGYQCPICTKQVADLFVRERDFADNHARVVLVYPGPAEELKAHAKDFTKDKALPDGFSLVIDPDFAFTNAWHLRWDASGETAYPSSFVIDRQSIVRFAKVSKSHGGRASAGELVEAVKAAR